jgi:threonylcarbamoyladenosine tRNA methylthiotransferase MtaB
VIEAVAATGIERLRLSSIEPLDLTPEFLSVLASTPSFCPHLHVPLQSGNDRVLSAMGRRYTAEQYAEHIALARAALPGLAVTTDVLCAFPGETETEAEDTLRLCEATGMSALHVFRYSPRPGTPAAELPGRVPPGEAARRAERLRACDARLRTAHAERRSGSPARVLVERAGPDGAGRGTTEDYLRVEVVDGAPLVGRCIAVRLHLGSDGVLRGEPDDAAC